MTCNKGYYLDWMTALKKMSVPEDSLLRDMGQLNVPFPLSPNQYEDEVEALAAADDEETGDKEEAKADVAVKESEAVAGPSPQL